MLPASLGLAGGKASIARCLLLGSQCNLPFRLLGGLTDEFGLRTLSRGKCLGLTLSLSCQAGYLPLGDAHFSRLNDSTPRRLSREDGRIISCRARPEPGEVRLSRFGDRFETINELVGFELTHVHSLCAPRRSRGGEKQMKPLPQERLRNSSWS